MINMGDLLGKWVSDPADKVARAEYGDTSLEFRANGDLIYTIYGATKDEIAILSYRICGDEIVTSQLSYPREEVSKLAIDDQGAMTIEFGNVTSHYVRAKE